ncbi:MAG: response regulator [Alphaproteobacteria bacterium]|nr:response regulator [Alphaproteobacteria bacterium]
MHESDSAGRKHLVIVDDEPVILQILTAVFEDAPYRLSTCATGQEALRLMRTEGVDVLLTDKNLPDVNGLELLRFAKEVNELAEVIIITGYASLETALTALELDAFDYVLKPLNNVFDIRKKVQRAVEKQAITAENRRLVDDLQRKNRELSAALEETRRLQDELIQSEKLAGIGTLAAGIAHEVSSPLFGIMGLAEAIAEEEDIALCHEYAGEIVEYSRNIRDIVVELSSYSRASSSEYLTTVELAKVVEDAARLVERSAGCDGVEVLIEVQPASYLNARTSELQQVFVNLIKNAVEAVHDRHGDQGGRVEVRAWREAGRLVATVSDNGSGIPEDRLSMVFDPFYTTKAPGKGTGLGLNIVYRIVTKYRGQVQAKSEVGEGTLFTLSFPVEDPE